MSVITNLIGLLNLVVGYSQGSDLVIQNAKVPPKQEEEEKQEESIVVDPTKELDNNNKTAV